MFFSEEKTVVVINTNIEIKIELKMSNLKIIKVKDIKYMFFFNYFFFYNNHVFKG